MKKMVLIVILFVIPSLSEADMAVSNFLEILNNAPIEEKYSLLESFMDRQELFPIIEDSTNVYFLIRQKAKSVNIAGDFNAWQLDTFCTNVPYTDLWYYTARFEPDARIDYKFIIDGTNWILDPLNNNTSSGGFGDNSELRMPALKPVPEIEYYEDIKHGSLRDTLLYCDYLGQDRKIVIYCPYDYSQKDELPFVVFHDGQDYLDFAQTKNILDYLIYHKEIKAVVAVFVSPVKRTEEYAGKLKKNYSAFITEKVIPFLYDYYNVSRQAEDHALIGASNGGNISLWLGFHYPELFRMIGAQSSYVEESLQTTFASSDTLPLDIYIDMGKYDIPKLKQLAETFIPILSEKGYMFTFKEFNGGHSWGSWKTNMKDILIRFFGT